MNHLFWNILAVLLGVILGGVVNMALIVSGPMIIPPPDGVDVTSVESIAASIHLFEPRHFLFPFLAHALGTLAGAVITLLLSKTHRHTLAYGVGALFLLGGITNAASIPAPTWFIALDLIVAYLPMAWLAIQLHTLATAKSADTAQQSDDGVKP